MPIRRAEPSDANGIAEVKVASWKSAYRGILPDSLLDNLSVEHNESRWRARIIEHTSQVLVFEQNDRIIGFVAFGASRDEDADQERVGEVYAIYLEPREWRRGHGSSLVGAAIESLQEEGYAEVTLWILHNNERGIKFYEVVGFEADEAAKVVTRKDGTELHQVRYRRST
jgi:ribosomal protein S18 acetylase RimI-like enzyme